MSIAPGSKNTGEIPVHESLDISGLPPSIAHELRRLVATLRSNLVGSRTDAHSDAETPDQWAGRLQAWVGSHPSRPVHIDDSREGVYAGRGE